MKERNKAVPAVYLLLKRDGKVLLGLRSNTGYQDGKWGLPSGHIEAGELPHQSLTREVKEEIGITIDPHDLLFVHASYREKCDETGDRVDLFFQASEWVGEIRNVESQKCEKWEWFSVDALPENTIPPVRLAIQLVQDGTMFSQLSAEWLLASYNPLPWAIGGLGRHAT